MKPSTTLQTGLILCCASLLLFAANAESDETASLEDVKAAAAQKSKYHAHAKPEKDDAVPKANLETYRKEIGPLLKTYCADCHGKELQEANFRVDTLDPDLVKGKDSAWWLEVMQVLSNSEMPPADESPKLADADRAKIINWLSSELLVASQVARGERKSTSFRRMTRYEYNYALQDLLGLPYDFARDLPEETPSEDGFRNSAEMLHMSPVQFATYREAARKALQKATIRGDRPQPVYYSMTMDRAADIMQGLRNRSDKKRKSKKSKFNANAPHFVNLETGEGVNGRYSYGGARYSWRPVKQLPEVPDVLPDVMVLPANGRQILDLGDHLPNEGTMRIRFRASRTGDDDESYPDLRISFGFQASNNSQAAFRVADDIAIKAPLNEPKFYEMRIPLGEIPRNPYRGEMKLGQTPNPSEYLVFKNLHTNRAKGGIQIDYIEITAPYFEQWPPASHQRVFFDSAHQGDENKYAREVLLRFMTLAWRRSPTEAELKQKLALFTKLRPDCDDFQQAMIEVLASVLSSPRFLYLVSTQSDDGQINDFDLATRLAMFLWSSLPDEELMDLAAKNKLHETGTLIQQTERMLKDPKAERFARHFVRQWLGMELLDYLKVDQKVYRQYNDLLKESMQQEPIALLRMAVDENASIMDFLHADYTMANERLAKHYGIPNVHGSHFRKVALKPEQRRGGLLTQAGLLAMNSDGKDSHPLKRGIWLLERILNDPPPPPPPAVPEIDLTDPEILKLTLKERMEDHRSDPACMSCHQRIDPWGIAFENFDATGQWRDNIGRKPVDATSVLFNGEKLNGMDGLKRYLLEHRQDQFARSITHKLTSYALGRPLSFADRADIEEITAKLRQQDDGMRTLVQLIVTSDLFRSP